MRPRRGDGDGWNLNTAINVRYRFIPSGRCRNRRRQEVVVLKQRDLQRLLDREPGNGGGSAPLLVGGGDDRTLNRVADTAISEV